MGGRILCDMVECPVDHSVVTVECPVDWADCRVISNELRAVVPSGHVVGAYVFGTCDGGVLSLVVHYSTSGYGSVAEWPCVVGVCNAGTASNSNLAHIEDDGVVAVV